MHLWFVDYRYYLWHCRKQGVDLKITFLEQVLSLSYPLIPFVTTAVSECLQLHKGDIATCVIGTNDVTDFFITSKNTPFVGS